MEQKSQVYYRSEKIYKNSREKFGYLIRETVSNSIHATLIKQSKDKSNKYKPHIKVEIQFKESEAEITVIDNGEGFNILNRKYFTHLDLQNSEKKNLNLQPLGQGRLAIVYFTDYAHFTSVHEENGDYKIQEFNYPDTGPTLFDIERDSGKKTNLTTTSTKLTMRFTKQQSFKRLETFIYKYDDIEKLRNYFIENFFPFIINNEKLTLEIDYNNSNVKINKKYIENKITSIQFKVNFDSDITQNHQFKLWLIEKEDSPKFKQSIKCFARQLQADLEVGRLEYEIDLTKAYDWYLTSDYFDQNVDQKGDKIEISQSHVNQIQNKMSETLDHHFKNEITANRKKTEKNLKTIKEKYHSIAVFIDEERTLNSNRVLEEKEIIDYAIENKGRAEKRYWTSSEVDNEDSEKLLNSSLNIYVNHRNRVLNKLHDLIKRYDQDGEVKSELEDEIHDLFLKRKETLDHSDKINHLHNLWILDDKYTIFSSSFKALSSQKGKELSDIYLWLDDPEQTKELLILELKSTSKAHNSGDKYESMVAQVKRYATQFYKEPVKLLDWDINPSQVLYSGIILARKSDIYKELSSNNIAGVPNKIPFLESSYYFNEKFSIGFNKTSAPDYVDIRIEIYSYEDIYKLALNRNTVFFKLLNSEYALEPADNN
ncbi:ATP-binding protein [Leptospira ellinghausenii]|nr:ATP-binding protein [Leptospira ellinghausenii]